MFTECAFTKAANRSVRTSLIPNNKRFMSQPLYRKMESRGKICGTYTQLIGFLLGITQIKPNDDRIYLFKRQIKSGWDRLCCYYCYKLLNVIKKECGMIGVCWAYTIAMPWVWCLLVANGLLWNWYFRITKLPNVLYVVVWFRM